MPARPSTKGRPTTRVKPGLTVKAEPEAIEQNKGERKRQRDADLIVEFLSDGLPHTRAEIGTFAKKNDISEAQLGRIKKQYAIAHVRVQPGSENGVGQSVVAWIIK